MGLKYSQVKEIYKRADWLFYNNLYDERNLARDMIEAAQQKMHLTALRRVLWVSFFVHVVSGLVLLYSVFGGR